jgi:hypothetical protein
VLAREGRNVEAREALLEAQRLDPSLKFASSPQRFNELLNKIPKTDSASAPDGGSLSSTSPAARWPGRRRARDAGRTGGGAQRPGPGGSSFPWGYLLIAAGVLFVVWKLASRVLTPPAPAMAAGPAGGGGMAQPGHGQPGYGQPGYGPAFGGPGHGRRGAGRPGRRGRRLRPGQGARAWMSVVPAMPTAARAAARAWAAAGLHPDRQPARLRRLRRRQRRQRLLGQRRRLRRRQQL